MHFASCLFFCRRTLALYSAKVSIAACTKSMFFKIQFFCFPCLHCFSKFIFFCFFLPSMNSFKNCIFLRQPRELCKKTKFLKITIFCVQFSLIFKNHFSAFHRFSKFQNSAYFPPSIHCFSKSHFFARGA